MSEEYNEYNAFVEIINQLLEFTTPEFLAEDISVKVSEIKAWSVCYNLPSKKKQARLFKILEVHPIWDECF